MSKLTPASQSLKASGKVIAVPGGKSAASPLIKDKAKIHTVDAPGASSLKNSTNPSNPGIKQINPHDSPRDNKKGKIVPTVPSKVPIVHATDKDKDTVSDVIPPGDASSNRVLSPPLEEMPLNDKLPLNFGRLRFIGTFFSIILLLGSLGYGAATYFAAFDDQGKLAYIQEEPTVEVDLLSAITAKINKPDLTLRTENLGWFKTAHDGNDPFLKDYDIWYIVLGVGAGCSLYWLIFSILEICKYCKNSVERACCVFFK